MGTPLPCRKRGQPPPQFSAHFYCRQTAECIKIPLSMEVGLSPGDFLIDGVEPPSPKGGKAPHFRHMSIAAKRLHRSRCHLVRRCMPQLRRHCVRWGPSSPSPKMGGVPPIFDLCELWPNGWMDPDGTWHGGGPWSAWRWVLRSRSHCARWDPAPPPLNGHSP